MTKEMLDVAIESGGAGLKANLVCPESARGVVVFAHDSSISRHNPRNRYVAEVLHRERFATLQLDLLTPEEEDQDGDSGQLRFDVGVLAHRLIRGSKWLASYSRTSNLQAGYFGASTGAAAALIAAAERPGLVNAVVSRDGRPDLAGPALDEVQAPTLLIVGSHDSSTMRLNQRALAHLQTEKGLEVFPGANHSVDDPGVLDRVARTARRWFARYLSQCTPA